MGDLNGKVAIVLGASTHGGMGEAIARRLKAEGATLAVSGLGAAPLEMLAKELGGTACEADITREAQIKALVDHTLHHHGRLDIAVNVAGVAPRVPFKDFTEDHLMFMAKMHFIGPAMFIKHVAEGIVDGEARLAISEIWSLSDEVVDEWEPRPTPNAPPRLTRITVDGIPSVSLDLTLDGSPLPGADATAARVVNAIAAVCAADPGVYGAMDLPITPTSTASARK